MSKPKLAGEILDEGGGGVQLSEADENSHCAFPSESQSASSPAASPHQPPAADKTHAISSSMRPFSRQFGRKYHLLDEPTRQLLHTTAKVATLPKLPIGQQPQLDPEFAATAMRLMDEIAVSAQAYRFHEDYFPKRHDERAIILKQLHLTHSALIKYLKAWRDK